MARRSRYRKTRKFAFTGTITTIVDGTQTAVVRLDKPFTFGGQKYKLAVINQFTDGVDELMEENNWEVGDKVSGIGIRSNTSLLARSVEPIIDPNKLRLPTVKKPWWKWPWW